MTRTGKIALIGGLTALAGAAAYFLFGNSAKLLPAASGSAGASNAPAGQPAAQATSTATAPVTPTVSVNPYEGRVIRADQEPAVYLIKDGIRHGFLSPDALHRAGFDFPQVLSVPKAIVMAIPEGSHISGFGLNGFTKKLLG